MKPVPFLPPAFVPEKAKLFFSVSKKHMKLSYPQDNGIKHTWWGKSLENYKNNLRKAYHCHTTYTDPQYIGGVGIILSSIPNLTQKSWFFPSCSTADICFLEKKTHSTSQPSACVLACSNLNSLKSPGMKIRDAKIAFPILLKICHWCKNRHAQSVGIPLLLPCLK